MENQNGKLVSEFNYFSDELGTDVNVIIVRYSKYSKAIVKIEDIGLKFDIKFKDIEELIIQYIELSNKYTSILVDLTKIFAKEGIFDD